jgi:monoamine oxidase
MGQGAPVNPGRRAALAAVASPLVGCGLRPEVRGAFAGASPERGHVLRQARSAQTPVRTRNVQVLIAGGGIAGLAAARALRLRGVEDFALLELEDAPGGNSRPGALGGIACPLGAHYLPVPGDDAPEVQDLLEELGLRRRVAGRWTYDEHALVHSPQERLHFQGRWQEGLLPLEGVPASTLEQYRRFAQAVEAARRQASFTIPLRGAQVRHAVLDGVGFAAWLDARGLNDPRLRWYLDYCCRDDYGAGTGAVSAWAGLHYFAARHGFHPPGAQEGERDALLTWPEGNGWLARALAAPLGDRFLPGRIVVRIEETRGGVEIDAVQAGTGQLERWQARHCIVALPVAIAARVLARPPAALQARAARLRSAPWVVVNLHLDKPLRDLPSQAPLAWDNVVYGAKGLGYVVATHQSLDPRPGATVLSWYLAPGEAARAQLLQPWQHWKEAALADLAPAHPDLVDTLTQVQVARYGHAMAVPAPGTLALPAPPALPRLGFAHGDWAGYSIFEEAFTLGHLAGSRRI